VITNPKTLTFALASFSIFCLSSQGKEEVAITPDPILFATVHPPPTATPLEIDAMKLAAQFTASCGRGFMIGLGRKEGNNPLFEVRLDEERSNELTTPSQAASTKGTRTLVQDTLPP